MCHFSNVQSQVLVSEVEGLRFAVCLAVLLRVGIGSGPYMECFEYTNKVDSLLWFFFDLEIIPVGLSLDTSARDKTHTRLPDPLLGYASAVSKIPFGEFFPVASRSFAAHLEPVRSSSSVCSTEQEYCLNLLPYL